MWLTPTTNESPRFRTQCRGKRRLSPAIMGALNGPLGLAIAPNGNIVTVNALDGNIVETTPQGTQIAVKTIETATGMGSLFGLAILNGGRALYFVDDGDNTLKALIDESSPPKGHGH